MADAAYLCGFCSFRLNVLEQAIFYYQKANALDPSDEYSYSDMAFILSLLSRFDEALFLIKKALGESPGDLVHLERLGMIELGRGEISAAISTFKVILQLGEDDADIHYYIGDCFFEDPHLLVISYYQGWHKPMVFFLVWFF